jgi:hypothetical protein
MSALTWGTEVSGATATPAIGTYTPAPTTWAIVACRYSYGTNVGPSAEVYNVGITAGWTLLGGKRLNDDLGYIVVWFRKLDTAGITDPVITPGTDGPVTVFAKIGIVTGRDATNPFGTPGTTTNSGNSGNQLVTAPYPASVPADTILAPIWNNVSGRTVGSPTSGWMFDEVVGNSRGSRRASLIMATAGVPGTVSWVPLASGVAATTFWSCYPLNLKPAAVTLDDTPAISSSATATGTLTGTPSPNTLAGALNDALDSTYFTLTAGSGSFLLPIEPATAPGEQGYSVTVKAANPTGAAGSLWLALMAADGTTVLKELQYDWTGTGDVTNKFHFTTDDSNLVTTARWNAGGNIFRVRWAVS